VTPGTLYVVATPLGHLGDLTQRAADLLRTVPVVAAEDTRRTMGLLEHLGAHPRLLSFHAHSPERRTEALLGILQDGRDVALVTDAGTPTLSDPGAALVAAVRDAGLPVVPIPGPSAVAAALSGAGLPADRFLFLGFIPRKGRERRRLLAQAAASEWTVVLYEAPPRLVALLEDLAEAAGPGRRAVIARELTKIHEEWRRGTVAELARHYTDHPPRGELTIVLEGVSEAPAEAGLGPDPTGRARELVAAGVTRKAAVAVLVEELGLSRNEAYRIVTELS
jgi:16S rRNA (cytidine1402-2'-O)-methyltransferase